MSTAKGGGTLPLAAGPDGLPDKARKQIEPPLPKNGRRGERWRDHRRAKSGILSALPPVGGVPVVCQRCPCQLDSV